MFCSWVGNVFASPQRRGQNRWQKLTFPTLRAPQYSLSCSIFCPAMRWSWEIKSFHLGMHTCVVCSVVGQDLCASLEAAWISLWTRWQGGGNHFPRTLHYLVLKGRSCRIFAGHSCGLTSGDWLSEVLSRLSCLPPRTLLGMEGVLNTGYLHKEINWNLPQHPPSRSVIVLRKQGKELIS